MLKFERGYFCDFKGCQEQQAFSMAINTLEQQPCGDAVSKAYIESIVEELENICVNGDEHILDLLADIKNAPSVQPQRPKGKWIKYGEQHYKCSACDNYINLVAYADYYLKKFRYCPMCGADMRGEEE